jgi:outer membrane protein assembly factor BamB
MMKKFLQYLILAATILCIVACGGKDTPFVAPLIQFNQTTSVDTLWTTMVGKPDKKEALKFTPTLYAGQIYTASGNGTVSIIDGGTGKTISKISLKESISSGLGVDDAWIYAGTRQGEIIAFSRKDNAVVWRAPVSNEVLAAPTVADGMVFVKAIDDRVYALDKQNGGVVWSYKQPSPAMTLRGTGSPRVVGDVIVVGFSDGSLGAFNRYNGNMLWSAMVARPSGMSAVEQMVDIENGITISAGVVYVATYQGAIAAIGLHSGDMIWEQKISSYASLALDAHHVYVSDAKGYLWALNRRTGDMVWRQENLMGRGITGPVVVDGTVVVADKEGFVHWMTAKAGQFVARTRPDSSGIMADPLNAARIVYIYTNTGRLVAYKI